MPHTFIIAEAGVNHNGSIEKAKQLIEVAAQAGADAVKFQTFQADMCLTRDTQKTHYQTQTSSAHETQYEMLARLQLNKSQHYELLEHCRDHDIQFLSSPFDLPSIDLLKELGMTTFKIPSGEITNMPYLQKIGQLRAKLILSTGMATIEEIDQALAVLTDSGTPKSSITLLHANSEYPTPYHDVNLKAMHRIAETFSVDTGYSDHTLGTEVSIAATAMGAKVIEKHFTLDRKMPGPDHQASLEPQALKYMVGAVRNVEKALGDGNKEPTPSETPNKDHVRKSLVASKAIRKGELLTTDNVTAKRPGTGLSPMRFNEIAGTTAKRNYQPDELIDN